MHLSDAAAAWADEYETQQGAAPPGAVLAGADGSYVFADVNPFLTHVDPFAAGRDLAATGVLSEAVLALEAEVRRAPANVAAWRLLGTVHAENDDDRQAIAALRRAHAAQPANADVMLSLGVSHTNELDRAQARIGGFLGGAVGTALGVAR